MQYRPTDLKWNLETIKRKRFNNDMNTIKIQEVYFMELLKAMNWNTCVRSFIPDISIAPLQVHYYLEALPSTALCRS